MKSSIILLFGILTHFASGQFSDSHLNLLSKINTKLTESWTPDIEINKTFHDVLDIPNVEVRLYNYKTAEGKQNKGVSIYVFKKSDSTAVKSYDWTEDNLFLSEIIETKSYLLVIDWHKKYNSIYDNLILNLIPELKDFFIKNKDSL